MTVASRKHFSAGATCRHIALVPGRCLATLIEHQEEGTTTATGNIHLHNLNTEQTILLTNFLNQHADRSERFPSKHILIVLSDFNLRFNKPVVNIETGQELQNPQTRKPSQVVSCCFG